NTTSSPHPGAQHRDQLRNSGKGRAVNAVDVHHAWAAWMQERDPHHRSIKPFEELDAETQSSDEPFVEAIRAVAERLDRTPA
ncbi:MAG: DUF7701 domain-containing protein, partial [Thermoleophilaceae bacterium]